MKDSIYQANSAGRDNMQPLVCVRLATYNHEKYIVQCIEGILMQKTDFPFEVIIGEDCSTDRTRGIVLAYQKEFPDKIKAILSQQNIGAARNSLQIQQACQGKYHAICEGDDYWIDPLKLQKQVDFMEAHPDVSLCFHNALVLNESTAGVRLFFETPPKEILSFADVSEIITPTASVMARGEFLATLPAWRLKVWCGDVLSRLWCAHHGNLGYLDEIMSVYRVHAGGMVTLMRSLQEKAREQELFLYTQLDKETNYQHTDALQEKIKKVKEKYQRRQNQTIYYLTHPTKILMRLRQYYRGLKRYQSIKDYGNSQ
jgi:glycosyltransferase involved in cell wall biosynthesis